jgi:hypothetical protein
MQSGFTSGLRRRTVQGSGGCSCKRSPCAGVAEEWHGRLYRPRRSDRRRRRCTRSRTESQRTALVHELIWSGILAHVPGEQAERELGWLDWSIGRKISDDGKWLLFDESGDATGNQAWVYLRRTDGAPPVLLGEGAYCDLSADGKWVAAAPSDSSGHINLLPTGAGEARKLSVAGLRVYRVMWLIQVADSYRKVSKLLWCHLLSLFPSVLVPAGRQSLSLDVPA